MADTKVYAGKMKIIGKTHPDKAAMITVLLTLHLWDAMSPDEREAAVERGEVWDTPAGNALMATWRCYNPEER